MGSWFTWLVGISTLFHGHWQSPSTGLAAKLSIVRAVQGDWNSLNQTLHHTRTDFITVSPSVTDMQRIDCAYISSYVNAHCRHSSGRLFTNNSDPIVYDPGCFDITEQPTNWLTYIIKSKDHNYGKRGYKWRKNKSYCSDVMVSLSSNPLKAYLV